MFFSRDGRWGELVLTYSQRERSIMGKTGILNWLEFWVLTQSFLKARGFLHTFTHTRKTILRQELFVDDIIIVQSTS